MNCRAVFILLIYQKGIDFVAADDIINDKQFIKGTLKCRTNIKAVGSVM